VIKGKAYEKVCTESMLFLFIALHGYAQSNNYQQANGTILESKQMAISTSLSGNTISAYKLAILPWKKSPCL
jgi:hypothetical protein